jgi:YaiO family outer membrane protein
MGQLERGFGNGWIGHAGFRRIELNTAKVNISKMGVEKYWGNNRAAYSASLINLQDTGTTGSQRVDYNRYYGTQTSTIGVSTTIGREVEDIGQARVLQSDIYNVSVNGKHWFHKNWALDYGYTFHKQGDIYNRQGAKFGVRYKF